MNQHTELRPPEFFIVGAPKSGTTAMDSYLGRHPAIHMSYRKEMHFFGRDLIRVPHEFFVLDEQRYRWMFRGAQLQQRVGEASVMYLMSKSAPSEIRAFNPDSRIIIMLRQPADMLYAYHSQLLWGTYEDIEDFSEALAAEPERRAGRRMPRCAMMHNALFYREVADYAPQVERYFDVFGRDRVLVMLYDDFKQDAAACFRRVQAFLEVPAHELPEYRIVNPNKVLRARWLGEQIQRPPALVRAAMDRIPDRTRYRLCWLVSRLNSKIERRQPMSAALRAQLTTEFTPGIERLARLLDRDLSTWVRP